MKNLERIELVEQAQEKIQEAQELIDKAIIGTRDESHYKAYGKYGFNQLLGNGNPYDSSLKSLIKTFNDN